MKQNNNDSVEKKLNAIIALLNEINNRDQKITLKQNVGRLTALGLSNKDVARILGISEKHVSKEKSLAQGKNEQ